MERSKETLGARFKTKMVVGAMALSLLPVVFMFFVSYSLLNRTLGRWFPRPLEIASEQTQALMNDFGRTTLPRLRNLARQAQMNSSQSTDELLKHAFESGLDALWILDKDGKPIRGGVVCDDQPEDRTGQVCEHIGVFGNPVRTLPSGVEVWEAQGKELSCGSRSHAEKGQSRVRGGGLSHQPELLGQDHRNPETNERIRQGKAESARPQAARCS